MMDISFCSTGIFIIPSNNYSLVVFLECPLGNGPWIKSKGWMMDISFCSTGILTIPSNNYLLVVFLVCPLGISSRIKRKYNGYDKMESVCGNGV